MNILDHIGAWKEAFLAVAPSLLILFAITGAVVLVASVAPNLLRGIQYRPSQILTRFRELIYAFSYKYLQELFSNGILHPKLF